MATRTGKVQTSDIKQGKTFFMAQADFPIIDSRQMQIGSGEVSNWQAIRPTGKPFYKGHKLVFEYLNAWGNLATMDVKEMLHMNAQTLLDTNKLYSPVFTTYRAMTRFTNAFNGRIPTKEEVGMVKHRFSLKIYG